MTDPPNQVRRERGAEGEQRYRHPRKPLSAQHLLGQERADGHTGGKAGAAEHLASHDHAQRPALCQGSLALDCVVHTRILLVSQWDADGRDMTSAAQNRGGAAERAHASIREAIVRGELLPGAMLSENELATGLAMSRTPVRAALTRLQDEGLVTIYPQRGALVRELSDHEGREAADVRHALESAGVLRSNNTRRDNLVNHLSENVDRQQRALAQDDFLTFTTLAMRFHRAFVELSENATMLQIYDRLQDRQQLSISRSAHRISGDPRLVLDEHRTLLEDAHRGDWAGFAIHLGQHQSHSHGFESGLQRD